MENKKAFDKFEMQKYLYYGIIAIVSVIMLVFLPMIGSDAGIGFKFPTTVAGWFIYVTTKLIVAVLNVLIFHCFMEQAKVNIKDNKYYIEANEILGRIKDNKFIPRGPNKWVKQQYGSKGVSIFISSILSALVLTQAILTYDYMALLTYIFTLIMGLIFGIIQMKTSETYWTNEYWQYAKMIEEKTINEKAENYKLGKEIRKCLQSMEKNLET